VARFLLGILSKVPSDFSVRTTKVNGEPGILGYEGGRPTSVTTLEAAEGRIRAIRIVVNPEKLRTLPPLRQEEGSG
jgi:RNA polymerase sigma-70 factor (ECF subfamily)